jgi:PAS domain S-box-containing protein
MENEKTSLDLNNRIHFLAAEVERLKKQNKTLIESQSIQDTLLKKSLAGYYIFSEGRFRMINPMVVSFTGYSPEEVLGSRVNFMVHPDDQLAVKNNSRAMLSGRLLRPYEFRIITKQGEIRWLLEVVASISFEGKPAILGSDMDITQQKLTERN